MYFTVLSLAVVLAFGALVQPASAHNGVDHSAEAAAITVTAENRAEVEQMIILLTQLVDLLMQQADMNEAEQMHHDDEMEQTHSDTHGEELAVWVELHSNMVHAHVQEPGVAEDSFMIEGHAYTEEAAIIAAIAAQTGFSEHDIAEVIVFPTGEVDEHGDSVVDHDEHGEADKQDISGIHIMSDGQIMWGDGSDVEGAAITAAGDIELPDGVIVTPAFDLR